MDGKLFDRGRVCGVEETRNEALGHFLRQRREAVAPAQVGILSHRGRRTPGLRREEVAFLADIGVKWYARLEAGEEIHPSEATLAGIAAALQLSSAEFEYVRDLASLRSPLPSTAEVEGPIPEPIPALLGNLRGVAATIGDKILTPIRWNALADVIYGYSQYENPVERNTLVRSLFDRDFIAFLGSEHEELVFRAVGMLGLNYSSQRPSPLAAAVYERIKDEPLFQQAWNRRIVVSDLNTQHVMVRNHAALGRLTVSGIDLSVSLQPDLVLRILVPNDEETATKFSRLEEIGKERQHPIDPKVVWPGRLKAVRA
ncbi:MAG: helix-turn-helix domain-containing protein [Candidatus Cybelea sp.]